MYVNYVIFQHSCITRCLQTVTTTSEMYLRNVYQDMLLVCLTASMHSLTVVKQRSVLNAIQTYLQILQFAALHTLYIFATH